MTRRFKRLRGDRLLLRLVPEERELLLRLPDELRALLSHDAGTPGTDPHGNPVLSRLFPRAYLDPTEEAAESEFQRLMHVELVNERLGALAAVTASLETASTTRGGLLELELSADQTQAWLGLLNDARLALGTSLGVTDDTDYGDLDPDDPDTAPFAIYGWLTMLQGALIEELL